MYKATLRDIEQKCLGADEAHTALLREVSDEHPAGLEGQPPGPHCPASTFSGPPPMSSDEHGGRDALWVFLAENRTATRWGVVGSEGRRVKA